MFVDNTLFSLILVAITLIIIVLTVMIVSMLIESGHGQKSQLDTILGASRNAQHKCAYSLGYLSSLPRNQPIPDECFGCRLALDCIKANPKPTKEKTDDLEKHVASAA